MLASAGKYNNKHICTEGVYVDGFEASALSVSTYKKGRAVYLTEPTIWIDSTDIIKSKNNCFRVDEILPPAEFCMVKICGVFEYDKNYGHLGSYNYQIRKDDN